MPLDSVGKMVTVTEESPPPFNRKLGNYQYFKWKKTFQIWKNITDVVSTKHGGLLVIGLDEVTQDQILDLVSMEDLLSAEGATKVIEHLDKIFEIDEYVACYEAYEDFKCYQRPQNMSIADYCNEFQHKLSRLKSTGTILAESVIAYKLLKSANLSNPQELLVKATTDMTYEATTKQLKKVFIKLELLKF